MSFVAAATRAAAAAGPLTVSRPFPPCLSSLPFSGCISALALWLLRELKRRGHNSFRPLKLLPCPSSLRGAQLSIFIIGQRD
jgi:hypothetical protein